MAKRNQLFKEIQNRVFLFFFASNVYGFVIRVDFNPRLSGCEAGVFALVPLHRRSCMVARACPNSVVSFTCAFAFFAKLFEFIEAFNVFEIVHHAKFAVGHSDFLTLIDKRGAFEGHLHHAKKLTQLIAIKTVRTNL